MFAKKKLGENLDLICFTIELVIPEIRLVIGACTIVAIIAVPYMV